MSNAIEWRPIPGYEDRYEVSTDGQVRRSDTGELRAVQYQGAIPMIALSRKGVRETKTIAAIVALAFVGPAPKNAWVDHLDGNPTNNHPSNLMYRSARRPPAHIEPVLKAQDIPDICQLYADGFPVAALASDYNVTPSTIRSVLAGRTWRSVPRPHGFRITAGRTQAPRTTNPNTLPAVRFSTGPIIPPQIITEIIQKQLAGTPPEVLLAEYAHYKLTRDDLL